MTAFKAGDVVQCTRSRRAVLGERTVTAGHYYRVWDVLPDGSLCLDPVAGPPFPAVDFTPKPPYGSDT